MIELPDIIWFSLLVTRIIVGITARRLWIALVAGAAYAVLATVAIQLIKGTDHIYPATIDELYYFAVNLPSAASPLLFLATIKRMLFGAVFAGIVYASASRRRKQRLMDENP